VVLRPFVRSSRNDRGMRITRLELRNYRAFDEAVIEPPASGLVLVAGQNNAGKSALLSAFDVVAGRDPGVPVRFHGATVPARIVVEFELSTADRAAAFAHSSYAEEWVQSQVLRRIRWTVVQPEGSDRFLWSLVETENQEGVLEEFGRAHGTVDNAAVERLDLYSVFTNQPAKTTRTWNEIARGTSSGSGYSQMLRTDPRGLEAVVRAWSESVFHFSAIRTGTPRRSMIQNVSPALEPGGGNLAECLLFHFSQDTHEWHAIRRVLSDVLPDVGELVVPAEGNTVEVAFVDPDSGARRNLKDLGSGVEQLLMTAYVGETQPVGSIALIEEPETSLHPAAQRELLRHLVRFAEDRLVIATTHSPVLLDGRPTGSGETLIVRRRSGRSEIVHAGDDMGEALGELGVRLSDVLSAERILLVEGESDAEILRVWFPNLLSTRRTAIVAMGGGDRAYHLDSLGSVLAKADALGRELLFVRDRDELQSRRLAALEGDDRIAVLGRRELENYFLDDAAAVGTALGDRLPDGTERPSTDSLAQALRAAAYELIAVVVLKRLVEDDIPPRLLGRAEVLRLSQEGPTAASLAHALSEAVDAGAAARQAVPERWAAVEAEVRDEWEERWQMLAPGADVLGRVWRDAGLRYDKLRDGVRIAAATAQAPAELRSIIEAFLA
jgi:predicted ATPase